MLNLLPHHTQIFSLDPCSKLSKLAQVVTLLSCILEMSVWNPSWHIDYLD